MTIKEICALGVVLVMCVYAIRYNWQIRQREVSPTLSTWILFLVGVLVSLTFYGPAEGWDLISGIGNVTDVGVVASVIVCILLWGNKTVRFQPWEKYYLGAAGLGVLYGAISGDLMRSNLFGQFLICVGYVPTWHTMIKSRCNTESFTAWCLLIVSNGIGLVPALVDGNILSAIYVIRALTLVSFTLILMAYYEIRSRRS
jgi:hypothetical protein